MKNLFQIEKIFSDQKFFWTKIRQNRIWGKINIFLDKIVFWTQIFLDQNFFRHLFLTEILVLTKNIFWQKELFGIKIFIDPKFCVTQIFLEPNFFEGAESCHLIFVL